MFKVGEGIEGDQIIEFCLLEGNSSASAREENVLFLSMQLMLGICLGLSTFQLLAGGGK